MRSGFRVFSVMATATAVLMASAGIQAGTTFKPVQSQRADGVELRRGAVWVSEPVAPDFVHVALGDQPPVAPWQPGDPIREIPRQFYGPSSRPMPVPANPVSALDALAQLQARVGAMRAPSAFNTPLVNVPGLGNTGVSPPDPAGDIGTTHYLQSINGSGGGVYRIFDKTGTAVSGTLSMEVLAAGGACANGLGDPIVLFDELANRWLLTEFSSNAGRSLCIYISQFADPAIAQTWTRYVVQAPQFPDYPKYGVWPDAYYVGTNEGATGAEIYALDRTRMLAGQTISTQRFVAPELPGFGFQVLQPIDLDGVVLPPIGAPGVFVRHRDDEVHDAGSNNPNADRLELFELDIDWTTPANSVLAGPIAVPISEFSSDINGLSSFNAFAQPSGQKLDPLREQVMFRPAYRSYASFEQIVGNLTTDIDGADTGGVRWFELRRTGGTTQPWQLYQEGTVALGDFVDRWMGAIAVDQNGNLGLAYSAVRDSTHPAPNNTGVPAGLRFIGRLDGDPVDVMTTGESSLVAGTGSQSGERWGDYHAMNVDPADGCTFWFTGEYVNSSSWTTRVAGTRHARCGSPQFMLNSADIWLSSCLQNAPQTIDIDLDVLAQNGFSGAVDLQFGTLPVGVSGSFAPGTLAVPGTSIASLSIGGSTLAGNYLIPLIASSGALIKEFDARLSVETGAIQPLSPADLATDVGTTPTLAWTATGNTTQYLLQIATDSDFNSIVQSATVAGLNHVPATALAFNTRYYWRVQRVDGDCGAGNWSAVRSFTTMPDPTQCPLGTATTTVFSDPIEPEQPGWTVTELPAQGQPGWSVTTTRPASPTRSWYGNDSATATEQRLDTPTIAIPPAATSTILLFSHAYNIEQNSPADCWDGATLDLSTNNGGSFAPLASASIRVDGYTRTITSAATDNPLGVGRPVWCGSALTHHPVVAQLGNQGGNNLKLRFRLGSDGAVATEGWYVDDLVVKACTPLPPATLTLTSSADPGVFGQGTTLTATMTGSSGLPTGMVEFRDGASVLGTAVLNSGIATLAVTSLSVGTHALSAHYSGDAVYGSSSGNDAHTVTKADTSLVISDTPDPGMQGSPVTISAGLAAVAPGAGSPGGSIIVTASHSGGCTMVLPATTCNLVFATSGPQTISASYSGDASFNAAVAMPIEHQSDSATVFMDGFED